MKNLVIVLSVALLSISMNVNAQEKPVAKKECSAAEKKACAKDKKTCSATEKKSCDKDKKAGCCAKKA
jgi:hypothetical protein